MAYYKYVANVVVTKEKKKDAESFLLRHGYDVKNAWQELIPSKETSDTPASHYSLFMPADEGLKAAILLMLKKINGIKVPGLSMRGKKTKNKLREEQEAQFQKEGLKKKPKNSPTPRR